LFPLETSDIDKFIYDKSKQKWEDYLMNIKKALPTQSIITTNDTFVEEKNDNISKIEDKSFEYNSFDDKEEGLFSYNSDA